MSIAFAEERPPKPADRQRPDPGSPGTDTSISDLGQTRSHGSPAPGRLVLIAEDHEGTRESLTEILRAEGYLVIEARDGRAALDVLLASPVEVLILDLAMPRVDGLELLRQIDPPPPVVIIYSAFEYYTPEELRSQVGSKVFRSLRKPVVPSRLLSAVADALEELDHYDE